jgi:hypothetical protein
LGTNEITRQAGTGIASFSQKGATLERNGDLFSGGCEHGRA